MFTNLLLAEERDRRRAVRARPPSSAQEAPQLAEHEVPYPQNVTLSNLIYFILAPTLVYETGYPRTRAVRPSYVMRYSAQAVSCLAVQYVLIMQFCVPVWRNSGPTQGLWLFYLKLALPSFASWLLMFWGFFHCTLNVIAELTRFADRQFYEEWWNATTLPQFWRWWNSLVHEWCLRHVYLDTVSRHNVRPSAAEFATFFISAVVHEYVCFVAFRMLRPYMFVGMMAQVPLMHISLRWEGSRHGNLVMWTMLFFGQPLTGLMYFRDFVATHGSLMCHE